MPVQDAVFPLENGFFRESYGQHVLEDVPSGALRILPGGSPECSPPSVKAAGLSGSRLRWSVSCGSVIPVRFGPVKPGAAGFLYMGPRALSISGPENVCPVSDSGMGFPGSLNSAGSGFGERYGYMTLPMQGGTPAPSVREQEISKAVLRPSYLQAAG